MRKLAKPLPLETPTTIELSPGNEIRVTLFDANHCVGAVMFLIEGHGKAVLYTGDIRAEPWWVNSIVQNPLLLPYTLPSRRLDCIYLDTTFATKSEPYREFPSKAEGIRELLEKVGKYPDDTLFYFHSWTFGYENVWLALSSFLRSQIHLDPYRFRIYSSLSQGMNRSSSVTAREPYSIGIREAAALCGFQNGNHFHRGCLTSSPDVRLHSCEPGMGCPVMDKNATAVRIIPIINRVGGTDILELGAGGGKGDLDQADELETGDAEAIGKLMQLCSTEIEDKELLSHILALLGKALEEGKDRMALGVDIMGQSQHLDEKLPLEELISVLTSTLSKPPPSSPSPSSTKQPDVIRFPYSRHSSYSELCLLVDALRPKDVYPCTVDENTWTPEIGIQSLFGTYCSDTTFRHDSEMMDMYEYRMERERRGKRTRDEESQEETQRSTVESRDLSQNFDVPVIGHRGEEIITMSNAVDNVGDDNIEEPAPSNQHIMPSPSPPSTVIHIPPPNREFTPHFSLPPHSPQPAPPISHHPSPLPPATPSPPPPRPSARALAYNAALGIGLTWDDIGGLVSTGHHHGEPEVEL
jgi:hypothetical protein